jgi:hypothetical protein
LYAMLSTVKGSFTKASRIASYDSSFDLRIYMYALTLGSLTFDKLFVNSKSLVKKHMCVTDIKPNLT